MGEIFSSAKRFCPWKPNSQYSRSQIPLVEMSVRWCREYSQEVKVAIAFSIWVSISPFHTSSRPIYACSRGLISCRAHSMPKQRQSCRILPLIPVIRGGMCDEFPYVIRKKIQNVHYHRTGSGFLYDFLQLKERSRGGFLRGRNLPGKYRLTGQKEFEDELQISPINAV